MDPWQIIGWGVLVLVGTFILLFVFNFGRSILKDLTVERRRRRANAGKLTCEDETESCQNKATYRTPNGYFCDTHRMENIQKKSLYGSYSWSDLLDYKKGV